MTQPKHPPRVWLEHIELEQFGRVVAHGTPWLDEFEYLSLEEHLAIIARERQKVWEEAIQAWYDQQDDEVDFDNYLRQQAKNDSSKYQELTEKSDD